VLSTFKRTEAARGAAIARPKPLPANVGTVFVACAPEVLRVLPSSNDSAEYDKGHQHCPEGLACLKCVTTHAYYDANV